MAVATAAALTDVTARVAVVATAIAEVVVVPSPPSLFLPSYFAFHLASTSGGSHLVVSLPSYLFFLKNTTL